MTGKSKEKGMLMQRHNGHDRPAVGSKREKSTNYIFYRDAKTSLKNKYTNFQTV